MRTDDRQQTKLDYAAASREKDRQLDAGERYRATLARLSRIPVGLHGVGHGEITEIQWRDVCRLTAAIHSDGDIESAARRAGLTGNRLHRARQRALRLGLLRADYAYDGESRRSNRLAADLGRSDELEFAAQQAAGYWSALQDTAGHCRTLQGTAVSASSPREAVNNPARACAPARASIDYDSIDRSIESIGGKTDQDWHELRGVVCRVLAHRRLGDSWKQADVRDVLVAWLVWTEVLAGELDELRFWEIVGWANSEGQRPWAALVRCCRREVEDLGHSWHRLKTQISRLIPEWMLQPKQEIAP